MKLKLGTESGLTWRTIRKYANSPRLQREQETGEALYFHAKGCLTRCGGECNGILGNKIAMDVNTEECFIEDGKGEANG